jgi:Cyclic nucleotide-binding domain
MAGTVVLDWLAGSKDESIPDLIARKRYRKAIDLLKEQFQRGNRDPGMRQQLADVLVLAGKTHEAIPILIGLADELAFQGAAARAIAILKRIERIEPNRADVGKKLASLASSQSQMRIPVSVPRPAPSPSPPAAHAPRPPSVPAPAGPGFDIEEIGIVVPDAPAAAPPSPPPAQASREPELIPVEPELIPVGPDVIPDAAEAAMTREDFELELIGLAEEAPGELGSDELEPEAGGFVASPLFSDFSVDELLAVIQGLRLNSFDPGDIVITEGEPGDSLFVLATGRVKVFVRNPSGRHVQVREMAEGSFFGEISMLTGSPRTATITAAERSELLELDRDTLDQITRAHPRVREILEEFYRQRANSPDEALVRSMSFGAGSGGRSRP